MKNAYHKFIASIFFRLKCFFDEDRRFIFPICFGVTILSYVPCWMFMLIVIEEKEFSISIAIFSLIFPMILTGIIALFLLYAWWEMRKFGEKMIEWIEKNNICNENEAEK